MDLWTQRSYRVDVDAPSTAVWSLMARPARWHEWAPHIRGAWRLGEPEVREGALGAARLVGVVPVPARIVSVVPGRSWTWQAGPVRLLHAVEPTQDGRCRAVFAVSGPAPAVRAYGPVVQLLLRNLARVAAR